ncbi:8-amino-7-oxononanoate synthase [Xylaria bambusicola]|uniref:8-amino-7-oxononanoate synthase n=1 Tax=Xylaria bambusicola TaxID=326684 RepID=UPI002007BCB5|nr:8-amino-7-oxononanoate synthase [Xylaria bambusicola]KAI0505429.1 8-amino-7-oxononanoate synthase [Xylaria bambusicola]
MYYQSMLKEHFQSQILRGPSMKGEPAFYRRLEEALDVHRQKGGLAIAKPRWDDSVLDLTTSDFLSLSRSGRIREAFLEELARCGDFRLSASGSRTQYGNYDYLLEVEREIAEFHNAETAWICHSGFFANVGVLEAIPLPGDAIVWDELSHASTILGLKVSVAAHNISFKHNSPDSLRDVLTSLKNSDAAFVTGTKSILISVESVYSMEGDICPLKELVAIAKELFPAGNAQFIVDEAHSSGVLGPKGAGLVQLLRLEKDIAIRIHMCSKALGSTGGVILCNKTVRSALVQYSRAMTFSGAPSVPMVASIRAGYKLLMTGQTQKEQGQIQQIVSHFFKSLLVDPAWEDAMDEGILSVPLAEDWDARPFHSHIVPVKVRTGDEQSLFMQLIMANINAYCISYPVVPKGTALIRLVFHAHNTRDDINRLISVIGEWAIEMLKIKNGEAKNTIPSAARHVFSMQAAGWK